MKKNCVSILGGLAFAQTVFLTLPSVAQEQLQKSLDEVVVTASRSPRKQSEIGRVVRVISSKQLAQSQGRTLPEILNNVAGLTLSGTGNGFGSNISVYTRGASAGNTLILIDGIPVNNASGITGEYDISSFAIDQIERVEILRGVNSTLYGSDAVAGVINIITKHPKNDKLNANILATTGNYNSFKQAIGLNGSIYKTGIALNFSNTATKGFSTSKDNTGAGNFDNDGLDQLAFNARATQALSDKFSISTNIQLTQNKFDLDGGAFKDDKDYTGKNSFLFGGVSAEYKLPQGKLNFNINQNNVWNSFINYNDGSSTVSNKGKITYSEILLNQKLATVLDLTAGANYRYANSSQKSVFGTFVPTPLDTANNIFSGFASLFFKTEQGLNLELGGRYNHHSQYGNNYTYTINPSFVLADRYKFFVSLASAYKVPSIYQLYSQYGNLELKPERSTSYEAGLDLELIPAKATFTTTLFKRDIKDLIYFYTEPKTFVSQYKNGAVQKDKGFEVELNTKPVEKFGFNVWYAFVEGKGTENDKPNEFLFRRPKTSFGGNVNYSFTKAFSMNVIYKYTGKRSDPFYNSTTFSTDVLTQHSFHLFDTYLQFNATNNLTLFADVKNIFDVDYVEWQGYNTRGRNFNAGLRYQIK